MDDSAVDDLGRRLKRLVETALRDAVDDTDANVATAVNVGRPYSASVAYSDSEVSIVSVDGETTMTRRTRPSTDRGDEDPERSEPL